MALTGAHRHSVSLPDGNRGHAPQYVRKQQEVRLCRELEDLGPSLEPLLLAPVRETRPQ